MGCSPCNVIQSSSCSSLSSSPPVRGWTEPDSWLPGSPTVLALARISLSRSAFNSAIARSSESFLRCMTPSVKCNVPRGRTASGDTPKLAALVTSARKATKLLPSCAPASGMHRKCVGAGFGGMPCVLYPTCRALGASLVEGEEIGWAPEIQTSQPVAWLVGS